MFGFGNSKQKKYKKALEEFLQKMMSVKDYFEIIQARGKGHAQMAEMLGVKVSDTDYWAKEHFEEYKSRFSQSNDPLSDIELRLKNYSFINKEMEGFINYAKELEMNLTQGFVDDYYAVVATLKSLELVKKEFSNESLHDEYGFRSEGEKNSKGKKIGVWKTYKTEDKGVTEYLINETEWVDHPELGDNITVSGDKKVFFKNGGLRRYNYIPNLDSEEYEKGIQKSGFQGKIYLDTNYYENGNIYHEKIGLVDDPNAWFETTLNQNGELISKGHIKNGLRNGNWRISKEATYYIPIIVKVISDESIKDDKLSCARKGDEIAFSITDKSSSIAPKVKDRVVNWSTVDYDDINRGYPFSDGIIIIDLKNAYTADESKSDLVNELASKETLYKIEIDGLYISNVEKLQEKTRDRDMFETDDLRKLVVQLSKNDYEILLSVEERIFAEFQLENNTGQEKFDKGDDSELKNIDGFDPNKFTYTGKTLSREDESKVDKENLLKYLNEYIKSEDFEEGSDLDSFCSWAVFEYGMSFEQDLILSNQEEIFYVEGENTMRVSCYFMEEQRSYDLKITIVN